MNSTWKVERKIYSGCCRALRSVSSVSIAKVVCQGSQTCPIPIPPLPPASKMPTPTEKVMGRWSRRLAPLLIRFGGLSDGDRVLDVGCGTGSLTFTVPEIANIAGITGIDLTEPFVEFARSCNTDPRIS